MIVPSSLKRKQQQPDPTAAQVLLENEFASVKPQSLETYG
jgi:hypothetical protein